MIIAAHPDDAEIKAGGLIRKYTLEGHQVWILVTTNGDAGHQNMSGMELAERRKDESEKSCRISKAHLEIMHYSDGHLYATRAFRDELITRIRHFAPDLVLTHRPNDYHPDHRYTSIAVQDASYLLTVPAVLSDVPHLHRMPVIGYLEDTFQKPNPFTPDVVVLIDDTIDSKVEMLDCHVSQLYEWLPYNRGIEREVPRGGVERKAWIAEQVREWARETADRFRRILERIYGKGKAAEIEYAEAFEICEYGLALNRENRDRLFPFLDQ